MYDAASQGPRCATLKYHCRHRHVRRVSLVLAAFLSLSLSLSLSLFACYSSASISRASYGQPQTWLISVADIFR